MEFITFGGISLFLLRLVLGQIFLLHGWRKLTNKESDGSPKYKLLGTIEVLGAILLITGFLYWLGALIVIVIMLGALFLKAFVWKGQSYVSNAEYDVLILLASLAVLALGAGAWSLGF